MTEQEQIIKDFKDKCEEIIRKYSLEEKGSPGFDGDVKREVRELADDIFNRHSNRPNIDPKQLEEDLSNTAKCYF